MSTTIIIMGGGIDPFKVKDSMTKIVQEANGTVMQSFTSFRSQRNLNLITQRASELTP